MQVELDKRDLMLLLSKQKPNFETFSEANLLDMVEVTNSKVVWKNLNQFSIETLKKAFELCKAFDKTNRVNFLFERSYHNSIVREIRNMRHYNDYTNN